MASINNGTLLWLIIGILYYVQLGVCSLLAETNNVLYPRDLHRPDHHTRYKRNATYNVATDNNGTAANGVSTDGSLGDVTVTPDWVTKLMSDEWYGGKDYMQRQMYLDNPNKQPTVCYNNNTESGALFNHFVCPMANETDLQAFCCGMAGDQHCCNKQQHDTEEEEQESIINDIDLVTGITIGVAFVVILLFCLFLYCCCCQRRPEIHDGIKLMWVRRSFGKELNRLEQPTYPNHLAIVSSRAGSHMGSRAGSRNNSRGPSPSVSRRPSYEPSPGRKPRSGSHSHTHPDRNHLSVDAASPVKITVTTPSDEHGPTDPLLRSIEIHDPTV